jgi:predicted membrane protein
MARIIIGGILVLMGLNALLGFSLFKFIFAGFLIVIGIIVISGKKFKKSSWEQVTVSGEDYINDVAVFSSVNKTVNSTSFKGGRVITVFGGGKVDLSGAKTNLKDVELEVIAVFGRVKVIIPAEWKVNTEGTAVLGGYDNKSKAGAGDVTLNIRGVALLGEVEITNK